MTAAAVGGQCINIPNSSRGKRKLDFTSKPLHGKVFFLDLPHGQKSPGSIEHEITQRGGIVEAFFHKKVRYMVTNRHKVKNKGAACSPLTLSPDTPEGGVGGRGGVTFNSPAYGTRAAKMLEASREKQGKKKPMDLIKMAKEWGVKLLTLEELMSELKKLKAPPSHQSEDMGKSDGQNKKKFKVRELKPPFLKVEDISGLYRPLIYEVEKWPLPNSHCLPNACPYDTPKKNGKVAQLSRATGARLTQDLVVSLPGPCGAAATARRKPGYCECCGLRYDDLKTHLQSKSHRDYATNPANFAAMDAFALDRGLDLQTFLRKMKSRSTPPKDCSILLITPPTSPSATTRGPAPKMPCRHHSPTPPMSPKPHQVVPSATKPGVPIDRCTITAGFSPKRGALCLTPIKLAGTGTLIEHAPATPTKHKDAFLGRNAKRKNEHDDCIPSRLKAVKRVLQEETEEVVPETPEKLEEAHEVSSPSLCNIQNLIYRLSAAADTSAKLASPKGRKRALAMRRARGVTNFQVQDLVDEITRDSPLNSSLTLSPGTSPLARKGTSPLSRKGTSPLTRKSPRLHHRSLAMGEAFTHSITSVPTSHSQDQTTPTATTAEMEALVQEVVRSISEGVKACPKGVELEACLPPEVMSAFPELVQALLQKGVALSGGKGPERTPHNGQF